MDGFFSQKTAIQVAKSYLTFLKLSGLALLGGHSVFLTDSDIHLGVNESAIDTAKYVEKIIN